MARGKRLLDQLQLAFEWTVPPLDALDQCIALRLALALHAYDMLCGGRDAFTSGLPALRRWFFVVAQVGARQAQRFHLALNRMEAAGLLLEHEGRVLLLLTERDLSEHRGARDAWIARRRSAEKPPEPPRRSTPRLVREDGS